MQSHTGHRLVAFILIFVKFHMFDTKPNHYHSTIMAHTGAVFYIFCHDQCLKRCWIMPSQFRSMITIRQAAGAEQSAQGAGSTGPARFSALRSWVLAGQGMDFIPVCAWF